MKESPSSSAIVPALLRHVAARGHDAAGLAARFGITAIERDDRDELPLEPALVTSLLEAAAELLGDPFVALRLPAEPSTRYTPLELVMRSSSSVRELLVNVARYGSLVHAQLAFSLDGADWHQRTPANVRGIGRHSHEYGLAFVVTHLRAAVATPVALERVWFAHARPRKLAPLVGFFETHAFEFGALDCGFALEPAALDVPLRAGDARMLATAAGLADTALAAVPRSTALAPQVAAVIRARLPGEITAATTAVELHVSARTLQRRLEDEGTSFTGVLDATREELARAWLRDPQLGLAEIGYRLGFADLATFSRAFKRWTGTSPGRLRHLV